jgi:hypothetical protein
MIKQFKGWYRESSSGKGFHAVLLDEQDTEKLALEADIKFGRKILFNNKGDMKASRWIKIGNHSEIFPYFTHDILLFKLVNHFMICSKENEQKAVESLIDRYICQGDNIDIYYSEHNATILSPDWDGYIYSVEEYGRSGRKTIDMKLYQLP